MAADEKDVTFDEKDVVREQVGAKTEAAFEKADQLAKDVATLAIIQSMSASMAAFDKFRAYAKGKVEKVAGAYEKFTHASELVADLVEVACEGMIEEVPIFGVLMKHGSLLGLHAANETENVERAAADMIGEMSQQRDAATQAVPGILEEHKWEIRNAYGAAKHPSEKEKAVKSTLAGLGIAVPKPDAGARIYQQLVEKVNIDAFIEACRTGRSGKTAECATDAAIPGIKQDAEKESKTAFPEDEGKKHEKAQAMPTG